MRSLIFLLLFSLASYSQSYKEKISIVQYSAEFAKDGEIDLITDNTLTKNFLVLIIKTDFKEIKKNSKKYRKIS